MIRKSQAVVPIKAFYGSRMAKKKMLENEPARLPTMVVKPAVNPIKPVNAMYCGASLNFRLSHQNMITTEIKITMDMLFLNNSLSISLPMKLARMAPNIINGSNRKRYFHCA